VRGDRTFPSPRADDTPAFEDAAATAAPDAAPADRDPEDADADPAADSADADPPGPGAARRTSAVPSAALGISAKARATVAAQTTPSRLGRKIIERGVPRSPSPHSQNSPIFRR
jgi:hypothetical protein